MNSICKKFKKVISSVVLSCSMVCSCGFANAGLWGRSISEADLDKIECLGNEWCNELKEKAMTYRMWREPLKPILYVNGALTEAVWGMVLDNDDTAAEYIKKFIDNEISLENLINTGSKLAKEGKICNFSLSCWMVRYLEERGIKCALTSVKKSFSGGKLSSIACFESGWCDFGVIVFFEDKKERKNKARVYIPCIMRTSGGKAWDEVNFENMCFDLSNSKSENSYTFLGQKDLAMLELKGRKGRDFDLVTAKSWGSAVEVYIKTECNSITAEFFEPIDDKLFNQLIPTSEKKSISKERGLFENFFSNNKKK